MSYNFRTGINERIEILKGMAVEWRNYHKRLCSKCGNHIPKGEGYEAVASYNRLCDKCMDKKEEIMEVIG